jgi:hypothetical protein
MNSKIVVLTEIEKVDVADVDAVVGWMLQSVARALKGERERES